MSDPELGSDEVERLRHALGEVPFAQLLGIGLGEVRRGSATLYLEARDDLKRNGGILHGGATAALIDTAAAFAVMTTLELGQTTSTVDLTVHYLRPINGRASATARVLRSGRRIAIVAVEVMDESELLVATALTTYLKKS